MKKIGLLNTAIMSYNKGDYIIMESVRNELKNILNKAYVIEIPTHSPPYRFYEMLWDFWSKESFKNKISELDVKFVCGTNLLSSNMIKCRPIWNINLMTAFFLKNCVLVGVGCNDDKLKPNLYTKILLKKVLSKKHVHSTRDQFTKDFLERMGFKAINTGCATMWGINEELCNSIPIKKSKNVVFTLTDYCRDKEKDSILLNTLFSNYEKLYFWIQGEGDLEYLKTFDNFKKINLIYPELDNYTTFLKNNDCDFIGTRLHAGIKAIQMKKRTIIIIVDNRARNINTNYNLNCLERSNINELESMINNDIITNINIDNSKINQWKKQFDNTI